MIQQFLHKIKDIQLTLKGNQEDQEGNKYSVTFFEDEEMTFSFTSNKMNDNYDIYPIIDDFYKNLSEEGNGNNSATQVYDRNYDFTYIEELPVDKLDKYNKFLEDGNPIHLTDFTPEQIVLIYYNLVLRHDVDKIYALTAGEKLPPLDIFKEEYERYLSDILNEDYLKYRFFDSIEVADESKIDVCPELPSKFQFL